MKNKNFYLLGILSLILFFQVDIFAQTDKKAELEKERQANLKKIEELNSILADTKQKKDVSLGKLNELKRKVALKRKEISNLNKKERLLSDESYRLQLERNALERRLERLKHGYSVMLYESQKTSSMYNKVAFLLLSHSFSDFMKRADFLRHFSDNRKKHAIKIEETQVELAKKQEAVNQKKLELKEVLVETKKQNVGLQSLRNSQARVFSELSKQEKNLRSEVAKRKEANKRLDNMIARLVRDEINKSIQRSGGKAPDVKYDPNMGKQYIMNAEEAKLAKDFAALKGKMPFPVAKGFIADEYGVHPHPVLRGVMMNNNGIDIQTSPGAQVFSVFKGIVQSVVSIPGVNMVVAIQHGDYFTVYSKLKSVSVKKGDKVGTSDLIGTAGTEEDGTGQINFQVWKNTDHLNPEYWLK